MVVVDLLGPASEPEWASTEFAAHAEAICGVPIIHALELERFVSDAVEHPATLVSSFWPIERTLSLTLADGLSDPLNSVKSTEFSGSLK